MAAPSKSIDASNPTAPAGRKALNLTYAPSNDRALRAIADELRRIGDALSRTANHVTAADAADIVPDGRAETPPVASPQEEALFQTLREWRAEEARKLGMPPYIVATDKVLRAVAAKRPTTVEGLREIPGFGPAKTAKYGAGLMEIVATR